MVANRQRNPALPFERSKSAHHQAKVKVIPNFTASYWAKNFWGYFKMEYKRNTIGSTAIRLVWYLCRTSGFRPSEHSSKSTYTRYYLCIQYDSRTANIHWNIISKCHRQEVASWVRNQSVQEQPLSTMSSLDSFIWRPRTVKQITAVITQPSPGSRK